MKKKFTFLIFLAIAGFHCSKNNLTETDRSEEPPSKAYSSNEVIGKLQLLTREVSFVTNNPNLKRIREFSYDEENRCTKIVLGTIDSSGNVLPEFIVSRTLTLYYNDGSSLPYKVASVRSVFPNLVIDFYYKYDDKGAKIQDSVRVRNQFGQPADRVIRYEYEKGLITATPELTNFSILNNTFDSLYINNANIVKKVSRMPTTNGDLIRTFAFEYDDKINPYSAINIYNSLYFTNPSINIGFNVPTETHYVGFNRNNISTFITQGVFKTFCFYEYDKFKYPLKSESFPESNPLIRTITYFTYKDRNE